jgi:hypothetical protein
MLNIHIVSFFVKRTFRELPLLLSSDRSPDMSADRDKHDVMDAAELSFIFCLMTETESVSETLCFLTRKETM